MPKPRVLDPTFWDDTDVAKLTRDERLLLVGMITYLADDEGRLMADPAYLRKRVFGYDDDLSRADVENMRNGILRACRNVRLYEVGGQQYLMFLKWETYQSIRYVVASKLPEYAEDYDITSEITGTSGNLPQSSVNSPRVGLGSVKEGLGVSAPQKAVPAPDKPKKKQPTTVPDDFTVTAEMAAWFREHRFAFDMKLETESFLAWCRANGKTYIDHVQAWQNWMLRESKNGRAHNGSQARNGQTNQVGGLTRAKTAGDQERADHALQRDREAMARRGLLTKPDPA